MRQRLKVMIVIAIITMASGACAIALGETVVASPISNLNNRTSSNLERTPDSQAVIDEVEVFPSLNTAPPAEPNPEVVRVLVAKHFVPVGFKLGAMHRSLKLYEQPDHLFNKLPYFYGGKQRFGRLEFANGQHYRFILDKSASGYLLYLDKNHNGNLRDDGAPLQNSGTGLFATTIGLPLKQIVGMSGFHGEYKLWVFANKTGLQQDLLYYYPKTQLSGLVRLGSHFYQTYLTDNHMVDGNYCNDGIFVDINNDGKIDRQSEYFHPKAPIKIKNHDYPIELICGSD